MCILTIIWSTSDFVSVFILSHTSDIGKKLKRERWGGIQTFQLL